MKGSENPGSQTFLGIWPSMIICLNQIWSYVAISQRPNLLWYNLSRALSKFLIEIWIFIYQLFWYMTSSQKKIIKSLWKQITSYWSWLSACQHAYVVANCANLSQNNQNRPKFSVFNAWKKYTTAGRGGRDKYEFCQHVTSLLYFIHIDTYDRPDRNSHNCIPPTRQEKSKCSNRHSAEEN